MDATVKKVAVAMCEADGAMPYEHVTLQANGSTPTALVTREAKRWEMYVPDARRFIAAFRALSFDI